MNERTYLNLTSDIYCFADDLAQALLVMDGTQRPETLDLVGLDWDTVQMDRGLNEPTAYAAKRVFQQTLGIDPADSYDDAAAVMHERIDARDARTRAEQDAVMGRKAWTRPAVTGYWSQATPGTRCDFCGGTEDVETLNGERRCHDCFNPPEGTEPPAR